MIQFIVDKFLDGVTLYDLVNPEKESAKIFEQMIEKQVGGLTVKEDLEG
jgi:hypothetical protein